jgi:hypothetical protein
MVANAWRGVEGNEATIQAALNASIIFNIGVSSRVWCGFNGMAVSLQA